MIVKIFTIMIVNYAVYGRRICFEYRKGGGD